MSKCLFWLLGQDNKRISLKRPLLSPPLPPPCPVRACDLPRSPCRGKAWNAWNARRSCLLLEFEGSSVRKMQTHATCKNVQTYEESVPVNDRKEYEPTPRRTSRGPGARFIKCTAAAVPIRPQPANDKTAE